MSLINEALKRAQRQRNSEQTDLAPPSFGGSARIEKRGQPRSAKSMLLLAAGGLVLFVLAVVGTVWVLNRPAPRQAATATSAAPKPGGEVSAPAPTIVAPVIKPIETPSAPEPKAPSPESPPPAGPPSSTATEKNPPVSPPPPGPPANSSTQPSEPPSSVPPAAPKAAAPSTATANTPIPPATTPAATAPAPTPPRDERINVFLDGLRVTGVRPSGNDSRVLMNERVYRLNDIVERTLGLRLTNVDADHLTFTDANGATYVKYF